jgi:hypothetical protein
MSRIDLILSLAGLILSLMVFSYFLDDKLLFGLAMVSLVGISAGFAVLVLAQKVLFPMVIEPLMEFPQISALLALIPLILAILLLWSYFKKSSKLSGIPLGLVLGAVSALLIFGLARGTLAPQLLSLVNAFDPAKMTTEGLPNWSGIFEAFMVLAGVLAVLFAFHHRKVNKKQDPLNPSWLDGLSGFGQVFIGITFGAVFVGLFSTSLTALIAYLQTLVDFVKQWI